MADDKTNLLASEIFEKLPIELVVFNRDFQLRYANYLARCTAFKFKNRDQLKTRSEEEIMLEWGKRNLEKVRDSNQKVVWEDIARVDSDDPQLIYRNLEPITFGREKVYLGYAFDITTVRRNEVDLDQGRTIFLAFLQSMEALVFIVNDRGAINYLSDNVESFFGGKAEDIIEKDITAIGGPFEENGMRWIREVKLNSQEKFSRKVTWQSPKGQKKYKLDLEFLKNPLDGNAIFGSLVDITKKENYEQNLKESINEANELIELKSNFINIVSHEMRTPLAGMRTSLELLFPILEQQKDQRAIKHLKRISAQVERMSEMMRDVIDMNRLGIKAGQLELVELDLVQKLREVIRYLIDVKFTKRHVELTSKVDRLRFLTDEKAFNTIFTNLIDNALKFSPSKDVRVEFEPTSTGVQIRVIDFGVGIPSGDQAKLFQSFSRATNAQSFEGTGLGLVIVKRYVELLNGSISLESNSNHTVFSVDLPVIENQLVVDDDR